MSDRTRVTNQRCEYLIDPVGIDEVEPRLSWELVSKRAGARQKAWHVRVSSRRGGRGDLWDSGRVESDRSSQIAYAGVKLQSRQRAWWRVEIWDERGRRAQSNEAFWEMGLLDREDWQAKWIGSDVVGGPRSFVPAPYLRRSFTLPARPVLARLYVTALGLYECELNGAAVGDDVFAPGWTDYRKRVYYRVHDVTRLLKKGRNAIGAMLGSGWYCGLVSAGHRQNYGDRPRLLLQLEVTCADGTRHVISSDEAWRFSIGPILDEDLINGESHDARRELGNWSSPGHAASNWKLVVVFDDPGIAVEALPAPPVRRQQKLRPVAPPVDADSYRHNRFIFDLGQNMVGRIRLRVRAPAGTTIRIRHAEMLKSPEELYIANLRAARATDYYTCRGGGYEEWEPRFTFHGFRYVELAGVMEPPGADAITGIVLHSDLPHVGGFSCSDPLINQLQQNIDWGLRGNFVDVPTDCPQRDERCGWTGDAQVFIRTATLNRDVAAFFTKWQRDLADSQNSEGAVANYAPTWEDVSRDSGPAWSDAIVICPTVVHERYGDERLLERHFESLAKFVDQCEGRSVDLIRSHPDSGEWGGFGDWLALDGSGTHDAGTPKDLIGTAFFAHSAELVARASRLIGRKREAARYSRLAARVKRAFQRRFLSDDGLLASRTQTSHVLALQFDLAPMRLRPRLVAQLVRMIEANGDRLATGFVGSPYLPHVLTRFGRVDVAYRLLHQKRWPSWLYAVTQGATTIWERWDGWTQENGFQNPEMNSFNHYAYGAIGDWLVGVVAGLDYDAAHPGGKRLLIRPRPGGELRWAKARLHTTCGLAESGWRRRGNKLDVKTVIPPNSTGLVTLPFGSDTAVRVNGKPLRAAKLARIVRRTRAELVLEVGSGVWEFAGDWSAAPH
ncbi:MAG TPA: family 78 glycoside hydrolase catalytic domain [Opitutaceae bacterium]|nr:family 78 glycoside hydrolase catalytic domain [Opitutaceae bacterium]